MENREKPIAHTTMHVQRAKDGDEQSLSWLARRFSPFLLAQANYRLRGALRNIVPAEDLVHDVWAIALRTLPELRAERGRETPAFMKFLSTTLLYRSNELMRRHLRRRESDRTDDEVKSPSELPAETIGILSRVALADEQQRVLRAIEELPELDRQVVILRAIEQHSNQRVAELLDQTPNAVSLRYNRALDKLRAKCAGTILDEISRNS